MREFCPLGSRDLNDLNNDMEELSNLKLLFIYLFSQLFTYFLFLKL